MSRNLSVHSFRVEVQPRCAERGEQTLVRACHQAGRAGVTSCRVVRLFFLRGTLAASDIERIAPELLVDVVHETCTIIGDDDDVQHPAHGSTPLFIDVTPLPGVTDPAAENLLRAAHVLGLDGLEQAATGQRYILGGTLSEQDLQRLAVEVFSNPVVQRSTINQPITPPFVPVQQADSTVEVIPLRDADDAALLAISKDRRLALDLNEMQAIRHWFQHEGRDPTDAELETLAQTWSEHCVHKTFRAMIRFRATEDETQAETIQGLLRTYIRGATERVAKPWIRSAFVDNAGIIAFDEQWDLAFKVETHNHPSALEPFGGANTGVGGVVRDVLGVSARPIANTDVLCFGPPDLPDDHLPEGVLHPRRIADGVVHGVEDYGNKMGIPTVNGAILYHQGYTANPLVFCGCLGLLPHGSHPSEPQTGDLIVVVGGRTGRDGLRGATFSSMEMDQTTSEIAGSAVQIGHPIHEKQVMEAVLRARDERLYHAITDCGAGGLASAVGEMGNHIGAHVRLETVPLKYPGLRPWEIWLSEAQERMVLAVPPEHWPRVQAICAGQDIEAVHIGEFGADGRLHLVYGETFVGDLAMDFLHNGIPQRQLEAMWLEAGQQPPAPETHTPQRADGGQHPADLSPALLALLAHPNIRSKEPVVRRYDHEVQGGAAVKPLVGVDNHGPGDAAVLVPLDALGSYQAETEQATTRPATHQRGVALGAGICPAYGEQDPYAMAWAAVDEAMRNVVCVGADPDYVALLDNFCWGNPNLPDRLGSLVRCVQGCYDAALAYNAPFVSGKDSLNNEYMGADGRKHAIPGTLLISALGIVPDVQTTVTMDLKHNGNLLYLVGDTRAELGGSHYLAVAPHADHNAPQPRVPQPVPAALDRLRAVHRAIAAGLVQSCHDCSEGGIGVALAEMCLAGRVGAAVELNAVPGAAEIGQDSVLLFSESLCRFIVEVQPGNAAAFETLLEGIPCARIGQVVPSDTLLIRGCAGGEAVQLNVTTLEEAWRGHTGQTAVAPIVRPHAATPASAPHAPALSSRPRVLVLHANGTNRDHDAALACEMAGGDPSIVHVNQLLAGERRLLDYHMLVVPGGFSYGDDLGAGMLWALDLRHRLGSDIATFVESGRPVLGICNGFQALVKAGLLPGTLDMRHTGEQQYPPHRQVTLAPNESGHFECRWVYLRPDPQSPCLFTQGLDELIFCPVAHGEGRLAVYDAHVLKALQDGHLAALTYVGAHGEPDGYPANPNGSVGEIAGLCNPSGNVLGLMPHPEDHIFPWQHPRWHRGERGMVGLHLFENGIRSIRG